MPTEVWLIGRNRGVWDVFFRLNKIQGTGEFITSTTNWRGEKIKRVDYITSTTNWRKLKIPKKKKKENVSKTNDVRCGRLILFY